MTDNGNCTGSMPKSYDVFLIVDTGIGNALQALHAVDYVLSAGKRAGIWLGGIAPGFVGFLRECFGTDVVVESQAGVRAKHLVHSALFSGPIEVTFDHYFQVHPTRANSDKLSEAEQYISIVTALFPGIPPSGVLGRLKEDESDLVRSLKAGEKVAVFAGCDRRSPSKRWPHYPELVESLGPENVVMIGGPDDLDYGCSYFYPKWITRLFPAWMLRRQWAFKALLGLGLLRRHAHFDWSQSKAHNLIGKLTWPELVALLRRVRFFVGNDGGLSHLAAACGAKGVVIFGPSSVAKNRPFGDLKPLAKSFECQPCQFVVNGRDGMAKNAILCPFQLRCLYTMPVRNVLEKCLHLGLDAAALKKPLA